MGNLKMAFSKLPAVFVYFLALQLFCAVAVKSAVDRSSEALPDNQDIEKDDSGWGYHEQQGHYRHHEHQGQHQEHAQTYTIEDLRADLQTAIEVEHFILPPYITAWFSIDDSSAINGEVRGFLNSIAIQEMLHFGLAGNILNAIGGTPDMSCGTIMTNYPSHVPGGLLPELEMPIEKMSLDLTRRKFMEFELPEATIETSHVAEQYTLFEECEPELKRKYCNAQRYQNGSGPDGYWVRYHNNTIGDFYGNLICNMVKLECNARLHYDTIFTGDIAKQVTHNPSSFLFSVTDLNTAVSAMVTIIHQGEGSRLCHPYQTYEREKLSHYYQFEAIYKGGDIKIYNDTLAPPICHGKFYFFNGTQIPFDPSGVWNMVPNPDMSMYPEGSEVRQKAEHFNSVYTNLLDGLQQTFNGFPDMIGESIGDMFAVGDALTSLVKTPIQGSPEGYTGGPTFDCVHQPGPHYY